MTRSEAKLILASYRSASQETSDRKTAEALQLAGLDPELKAWLAEQQNFHAAVAQELRAIPVPPELKAKILAGRRVLKPTWSRAELLAIAASLVLLIAAAASWFSTPASGPTLANFQLRMRNFALRTYQMEILSKDEKTVREFLKKREAPADFALPPRVGKLGVKGGGRLLWQNQPVAMICFDLPGRETLYLFVVDERNVRNAGVALNPTIDDDKRLTTATWATNGKIYLLAAHADRATIAALAGPNG